MKHIKKLAIVTIALVMLCLGATSAFAKDCGPEICKQPNDVSVNYPFGTSFTVIPKNPLGVVSYQWYFKKGEDSPVKLYGVTAKLPTLIFAATAPALDDGTVYCVLKDIFGNETTTEPATINIKNADKRGLCIGDCEILKCIKEALEKRDCTFEWPDCCEEPTCPLEPICDPCKGCELAICKQPEDVNVTYPLGTSFTVAAKNPLCVTSYQWHFVDENDNDITLKGVTAKLPTLIFAATAPALDDGYVYCVLKDAHGNEIKTNKAYINIKNADKCGLCIGDCEILKCIKEALEKIDCTYKWPECCKKPCPIDPICPIDPKDPCKWCELAICKQPKSVSVNYPLGTSFTVVAKNPLCVTSYQWYFVDEDGNEIELKGVTAKLPTLIFAATAPALDDGYVYCVLKDAHGNEIKTNKAYINIKNADKCGLCIGDCEILKCIKEALEKIDCTYKWPCCKKHCHIDPICPVKPVCPVKPILPVKPVCPVWPVCPVDPVDPVEPTDPADPTEPTTGGGEEAPKTGDDTNILLWTAMFGISAAGITMLTIAMNRSKKEN